MPKKSKISNANNGKPKKFARNLGLIITFALLIVGILVFFNSNSNTSNIFGSWSQHAHNSYYCGIPVNAQQYNALNSEGQYQYEGNPCHLYYINGSVGTYNITLNAGIDGPITLDNNTLLVPLETPTYNYSPPSYYSDLGMMWGGLAAINAKTGNVLWQDLFNDSAMAQPLVVNGIAYVGTGDDFTNPNVKQNGIYAVNISTGKIIWNISTAAEDMPSFAYYNNSVIKIGGYIPNFNNTKAPPTLQGIFDLQTTINTTNTTGYLQALNPQTGNLEWEINISGSSAMSSPVLVGNMVYFGANSDSSQPNKNSGKVMAINLDTHQIVWTTYFPSGADRATQDTTLSIWNNTLVDGYAYTYNSSGGPQNRVISLTLVGINITNGNIKWKFNEPLGKNTPRSVLPPTTAYNGIVLSDTTEIGWLYALNIQTGNLLWKFYTGPELPNPQIIDGYVFAENQTGTVFVLELNGTLYESFNLGTPEDWCGSAQIVQIGNSIVFGGENGQLFSMPISEIINSSD